MLDESPSPLPFRDRSATTAMNRRLPNRLLGTPFGVQEALRRLSILSRMAAELGGARGVPHVVPGDRGSTRGSLVSAPLLRGTALLGLLLVERVPAAPDFTLSELDMLSGVAAQAALVLERLRGQARDLEARRATRDLELA